MVAPHATQPAEATATGVALDDAVARVTETAGRAHTELVTLDDAAGRVLAADLASRGDLPNCHVSAMDGYACRASDTAHARSGAPVTLRLVGESAAGRPFAGTVGPGEATTIFTGAPVPQGADAILRLEDAWRSAETVTFEAPATPGDIRARADQLAAGTTYLDAGTLLTPRAVLLAAAMGHGAVAVAARPRVAVVVTGDEIVDPGQEPARGQVVNANAPAIAALARAFGAAVVDVHHAGDDRQELARTLRDLGLDVDLLVTTGGAAAGRYDQVHALLTGDPLGRAEFTRVQVRPGGPASFGSYAGVPLLALPGNPAAAAVIFQVLGAAWLYRYLGRTDLPPYLARSHARAAGPFRHAKHKTGLWPALRSRATADDAALVEAAGGGHGDGPALLGQADCLAITAPWQDVPAGGQIEVMDLV